VRPVTIVLRFPRHLGALRVRPDEESRIPECNSPRKPNVLTWTSFLPRELEPPLSSQLPLSAAILVHGRPAAELLKPFPHVRAGHDLHYTVSLRNFSRRAFRFGRCPSYEQSADFADDPTNSVKNVFILNCGAVKSLVPRERVLFEMVLRVPPNAKPGVHSVSWMLAPQTYLPPWDAALFVVSG